MQSVADLDAEIVVEGSVLGESAFEDYRMAYVVDDSDFKSVVEGSVLGEI